MVLRVSVDELLAGSGKLPFTTRSTWSSIQSECPDLRRTHAHLKQGTRPSKKVTNIRDVRRYLNVTTLSRDGLVVVPRNEPLASPRECIVVPRQVLHGLLTALHVKLDHPSCYQLKSIVQRFFFALDLTQAIELVTSSCHMCSALCKTPHFSIEQSTTDPPEALGTLFAADVLRRERQLILVLREYVSSYTVSCIIDSEQRDSLRDALIFMCLEFRPLDGPPAVIRTDCAPGFASLVNDELLKHHHIAIELGRSKNVNKNPIAERAIQELEVELRYDSPRGGQVTSLSLAIITARLNSRIRSNGFSSREIWMQRDQFTNSQLPFKDQEVILDQHKRRCTNHSPSEISKAHGHKRAPLCNVQVGDIVYLYTDLDKIHGRDRYLVTSLEGNWCSVRKFVGAQLRNMSYRIKRSECFKVPSYNFGSHTPGADDTYSDDEEVPSCITPVAPPSPVSVPSFLATPVLPSSDVSEHSLASDFSPAKSTIPSPPSPVTVTSFQPPNIPSLITTPVLPSSDVSEQSYSPPRRSTRTRRPPDYLKDFTT